MNDVTKQEGRERASDVIDSLSERISLLFIFTSIGGSTFLTF